MAWKCLTEEFHLDESRLYATYFGGDESTPCDDEARDIWLQFLPPERVLPFDAKDNFWEMGATGPCGPCTVCLSVIIVVVFGTNLHKMYVCLCVYTSFLPTTSHHNPPSIITLYL